MRKKDMYRYVYPIHNKNDTNVAIDVCNLIVENFAGLEKDEPCLFFDLTVRQTFFYGERKISVYCDELVDAVYVCSDIEISHILGVESIY